LICCGKKKQETKGDHELKQVDYEIEQVDHEIEQAENDFDILIDFPEFKDYLESYFSEKIKSICCVPKDINHGKLAKFISVIEKINIEMTVSDIQQYIKILESLKKNPEQRTCTQAIRLYRR